MTCRREGVLNLVEELLTQFSLEQVFLFLVLIFAAVKFIGEVFDWFYKKAKNYFGEQEEEQDKQQDIIDRLERMERKADARDAEVKEIKDSILIIQARLQDSTRSYIIDKYHYYHDEVGAIDEAALQDLERRFLYYKDGGGDSFIEVRMNDLRHLPIVSAVAPSREMPKEMEA